MKKRISFYRAADGKRKCRKKNALGFTLVETLTVLSIIAILSATLIPALLGFVEEAKRKAYVSEAYLVMAAAQVYVIEKNLGGKLDEFVMYDEIFQYEVSDPANALYGLLEGSVTKGSVIKLLNYNKATSKVSGICYLVKDYKIEIDNNSEVKISDRD